MHDYSHTLKCEHTRPTMHVRQPKYISNFIQITLTLVLHGHDDPTMILARSSQDICLLTGIKVGPTHVGPSSSFSTLVVHAHQVPLAKLKSHMPKIEE